ncbi:hypothetical protein [Citreimonas salinaria]|uniref:Uncharacterized protein n=1 Tax=Citreimonas salinaria TaxID=321339 RepID=A0A1H3NV29_9RHOB|nr:hypothetical protein [Citreimonas salinaria]SDY92553.1 hypothetical protein SAMN05444340_1328 [Citreimonas salinaria]
MPVTFRTSAALCVGFLTAAAASAPFAQQQDDAPEARDVVVVVAFSATGLALENNAVNAVIELARDPNLSDVEVSVAEPEPNENGPSNRYDLDGALVFSKLASFTQWHEKHMDNYFAPVGGLDAVETSFHVARPDLLELKDLGAEHGLEDVSISYSNSGNDAAGDADIDAVTVICPGDHADCKPSN